MYIVLRVLTLLTITSIINFSCIVVKADNFGLFKDKQHKNYKETKPLNSFNLVLKLSKVGDHKKSNSLAMKSIARYPISDFFIQIKTTIAYNHYMIGDYETSILFVDSLLSKINTKDDSYPYLLYLKAMCNYKLALKFYKNNKRIEDSINIFNKLKIIDANGIYGKDCDRYILSLRKIVFIKNMLISDYYFIKKNKKACLGRLNYLKNIIDISDLEERLQILLARQIVNCA